MRSRPLSSKEVAKSSYETVKVLDERVAVLLDPGYELNPDDVSQQPLPPPLLLIVATLPFLVIGAPKEPK